MQEVTSGCLGIGAAAVLLVLSIGFATSRKTEPSRRETAVAPPPPKPPLPLVLEKKPEAVSATATADRSAVAAFKAVRDYELANPNDIEEIAERYARMAVQFPSDDAAKRAEQTKTDLAAAMEKRKILVLQEAKAPAFGPALEAVDRHTRDYRNPDWRTWIDAQRFLLQAALNARAQELRAKAAWEDLAALGVPALAAEAEERILARTKTEENRTRLELHELKEVGAYLDKSEAAARERKYEMPPPVLESAKAKDLFNREGAFVAAAGDVYATAWEHARGLKGKAIRFDLKDGAKVAGDLSGTTDQPPVLLVGGKTYRFDTLSTASLAAFYKAARGVAAKTESILAFAVLDGNVPLAADLMKRTGATLGPRAEAIYKAQQLVKKPDPTTPVTAKKPEKAKATEVVVYASDLPAGAVAPDFEVWNEAASPGGKMVGMRQKGQPNDPPPEIDAICTFKVQIREGIPYRCWVRMKVGRAQGSSQANLLWMQFTGATTKGGKEICTLGTADYLTLRGPTQEGWVWVGPASPAEPHLYFRGSGEITVRLYAGMEGVGFDQIVLSPARFLDGPPTEAVVPQPRQ